MISRFNKRLVYACTFCWFGTCSLLKGQDTTLLKEVDVTTQKIGHSALGKKTDKLDSATHRLFAGSSLAEVLGLHSSVFVKTYGPGALASTALRGGNASQTAILWNGFNLQNSMLGQFDLALLPLFLFDEVQVEYGGSSALWSSGAMAGSIQLMNKAAFGQGVSSRVNLTAGSFGQINAAANMVFSKEKFYSSTKVYLRNAINNYPYLDTLIDAEKKQELRHAAYSNKGILQEFKFISGSKQSVAVNAWYNQSHRQIPSFNPYRPDKAFQVDENLKTSLNWNYAGSKWHNSIKTAYFSDVLNFSDALLDVRSSSRVNNLIFENENIYQASAQQQLIFGANYTGSGARSSNYLQAATLHKAAFLFGDKISLLDKRLNLYPVIRAEYFSVGALPITGNLSAEYFPVKSLSIKANAAKVYRQPTFNELFWFPGGNSQLRPEQGYTTEGEAAYSKSSGNLALVISGAAFSRMISDWILWLPGAFASPSPVNIQKVWSRGTETKTQIVLKQGNYHVLLATNTSYVLSTVEANAQENDNSRYKQLIYTPRYSFNGRLSLAANKMSLTYYYQYVGYRFTASDNSQWLNPYHLSALRYSYQSNLREDTGLLLFMAVNNLLNKSYAVVAGRHMPLRNFEIGISLSSNKKNKIPQTIDTP